MILWKTERSGMIQIGGCLNEDYNSRDHYQGLDHKKGKEILRALTGHLVCGVFCALQLCLKCHANF